MRIPQGEDEEVMNEILFEDATTQAAMVRKGECTPLELVDAAIARIEKVNPVINAVIHERFEKAREEAKGPLPDGPFRGVPMCMKDSQVRTAGDPYHLGLKALRDAGYRASHDSQLAINFRKAGFINVGRTNVPEMSCSSTTESRTYGPVRNAWNTDLSTGGSGGGSSGAVAAGMVSIAHSNDTGGSTRQPASCCGLVGIKPTRGYTSFAPDLGSWEGMLGEHGVITRTVRDNAAIMDAIIGTVAGDAYRQPPRAEPLAAALNRPRRPLKIGYRTRMTPMGGLSGESAPECVEAIHYTVEALRELGHDVREAGPAAMDEPGLVDDVFVVVGVAFMRDLAEVSKIIGRPFDLDELEPLNKMIATAGRDTSGHAYLEAIERLYAVGRKLESWWSEGWDIFLTPTQACPPPRIGEIGPEADFQTAMPIFSATGTFTQPFNPSGQPAISLPMYRTADNVPIGVQLVASWGKDDLLYELGAQLEAARPWNVGVPSEESILGRQVEPVA